MFSKIAQMTQRLDDYELVKKQKRLCIVDRNFNVVYTPPDFLLPFVYSRKDMHNLCDDFNRFPELPKIVHIVHFENLLYNRRQKKEGKVKCSSFGF